MMLDVLKYAAWAGVILYARHLFRKARMQGLAEGYTIGYCAAMDKVKVSIERTNNVANLAASMDDPMDARQYVATLHESLVVTLGVHDKGLL